jgi:chorismate dehydratase
MGDIAVKVFRIITIKLLRGKVKKNRGFTQAFFMRGDFFQETVVLLYLFSYKTNRGFKSGFMNKYKVSLISYLNSRPFLYGLENSPLMDEIELTLDIPSKTAEKMTSDLIDIGLMPVASLLDLSEYQIISDYCIGADGPVRTVVLASEVPLGEIESILMDYQSRSSVMLTQILARFYWKKEFKWRKTCDHFEENAISGSTAGIVIGDRVFRVEKRYPYIYDLSSEWNKHTGLPFVFAVWATQKPLSASFLERFNEAVASGVLNVPEVEKIEQKNYPGVDIYKYFTQNISYTLDDRKKEGMAKFLELCKKLPRNLTPGWVLP